MRLSEMRIIIKENQENLKITVGEINGNPSLKSVSKVPECLKALNALKAVPSLAKLVQQAQAVQSIYQIQTEQVMIIDASKVNAFNKALAVLNTYCSAILAIADNMLPPHVRADFMRKAAGHSLRRGA